MNAVAEARLFVHAPWSAPLEAFEARYQALLAVTEDALNPVGQALWHAAACKGKRVRPMLMMHAAHDLGLHDRACLDLAAAVEMIHTASLIIDDLPCMDDAALRRGQPTVHRLFGQDVAILAAIALIMKAFEVVSGQQDMTPAQRMTIVGRLSAVSGFDGLIQGQMRDLQGARTHTSLDEVATTNALKTGSLFTVAFEAVGVLAWAEGIVMQSLRGCAHEIGQAFQLVDDLRDDPKQDPLSYGKDVGKDLGKNTGVQLMGLATTRERILAHMQRADRHLLGAAGGFPSTRHYLQRMLRACMA